MRRLMQRLRFWTAVFCLPASVALIGTTVYFISQPFPRSWNPERAEAILFGALCLGGFAFIMSASFFACDPDDPRA